MGDLFPIIGDTWFWFIVGLALLIGELLVPGIFLLWLAIAAGLTGSINFVFDLGWRGELGVFAVLSILLVLASWSYVMKQRRPKSDQPDLNQRQVGYVGRRATLLQAISNGSGKVKFEDVIWDVTGPDLPQGAQVTVKAVNGATLVVEAAQ
jgi:membrane protein implicated in regulation of membrane protease activity